MALQKIPEPWRTKVIRILRAREPGTVRYTEDARNRFEGSFPGAFPHEIEDAHRGFLNGPHPWGCPIEMSHPRGETWEFLFAFRRKVTYGKILLRQDRQRLIVFSVHLADKKKLSCE